MGSLEKMRWEIEGGGLENRALEFEILEML